MARPIWTGTISFGLVTVPVALYSATEDHSPQFRQIEHGTSDRIRYQRINERTGKEVPYSHIAKGFEVERDEYIEISQTELDDITPKRSRDVEIESFVAIDDIDPIFFDRTYWLTPTQENYARAYHLLVQAMAEAKRVGIAMFVMHGRQHLAAIRPDSGVLALMTMRFADEIRDPATTIPELPKPEKPRQRELTTAIELIKSMSDPWRPENYQDTYTEQVKKLVADKRSGQKPKRAKKYAEPTNVLDLTEALQRSVRKTGRNRKPNPQQLSQNELTQLARELHIRGRSTMNRAELVKAINKQQAS